MLSINAVRVAAAALLGALVITPATARASAPLAAHDSGQSSEVATTTGWYTTDDADTISIFEPAGPGPYPAVIFVHGGAWGRAQPNAYELSWAADLARSQGWLVAVIGYPTKVPHEHIAEPYALALAIQAIANRSDVINRSIALWGESAGGQLALLAAYRDAAAPHPAVRAVVSISGPTDMVTEFSSLAQTALGAVTRFEGLTPREARRARSARYRDTSPVNLVTRHDPATFQAISCGDRLVPARQVTRLSRLLAAAHVRHRTVILPGDAHSTALETQRPAGSANSVADLAEQFLTQVFRPTVPTVGR